MSEGLNFGSLKCDACGKQHPLDRKLSADMVGTPCTDCGENLLTEEDFKDGLATWEALNLLHSLGLARNPGEGVPDNAPDGVRFVPASFNSHKGSVNIKIDKINDDATSENDVEEVSEG